MRVATKSMYENIKVNLARTTEALVAANNIVSTGKRVNKLSDDPVAMISVMGIKSSLKRIGQLERNIAMGKSWLNSAESALTQINDLLSATKALAVEMANSTKGQSERANAAGVVDGYMRQILALVNTDVGGRYIFSGTKINTVPFSLDDESNPTQVHYNGNSTAFSVRIDTGVDVEVGRDGETIIGDDNFDWSDPSAGNTNMFKVLLDLKRSLENNDSDGISEAIGRLDNILERIGDLIADTGTKIIRMDTKENILKELELTQLERRSKLEDADIAEAVMDLKARETAYQAALASSAKVMRLSLVNFL